ncbi:MAG TPA: hypothetical protein DDY22_16390 [Geobacter sp.]|nr:hypothetical protein [Geobacter sp.]
MLKTATTVVLNRILAGMPALAGILGIGRCAKPPPGSASGTAGNSKEGVGQMPNTAENVLREWPSEIAFQENETRPVKGMEPPRRAHCPHSQMDLGRPTPSEGAARGMFPPLHLPPQRQ